MGVAAALGISVGAYQWKATSEPVPAGAHDRHTRLQPLGAPSAMSPTLQRSSGGTGIDVLAKLAADDLPVVGNAPHLSRSLDDALSRGTRAPTSPTTQSGDAEALLDTAVGLMKCDALPRPDDCPKHGSTHQLDSVQWLRQAALGGHPVAIYLLAMRNPEALTQPVQPGQRLLLDYLAALVRMGNAAAIEPLLLLCGLPDACVQPLVTERALIALAIEMTSDDWTNSFIELLPGTPDEQKLAVFQATAIFRKIKR